MKQKSSRQALVLFIFSILFIILGIFTIIFAVDKIINYDSFYIFCLLNLTFAIVIGFLILNRLKPVFKLNPLQERNFFMINIYFTIGFFGLSLHLFHFINSNLVYTRICERHNLVNKERIYRGRKTPSSNYLFFDFDGEIKKLNCDYKYWLSLEQGNRINICQNESYDFNYLELTDQ